MSRPDKRILCGLLLGAAGALVITAMGAGPAPSVTGAGASDGVPASAVHVTAVSFQGAEGRFHILSDVPFTVRKGRSPGVGTSSPGPSLALYEG
ncbi:MAG: hypothetical protein JWQ81_2429 [Amycolatopsis sp.]|jgi:hypothetical protein|uniref:hypothetical protein n=1 Tax=Amycolatopsis sp. TaxID=37632 RepID=UPI0026190B7E|nr:hypothetical protein [Amycolatopsis sp.]MCU1681690.1 hypothetical protein [Amycolatopsis sp.]